MTKRPCLRRLLPPRDPTEWRSSLNGDPRFDNVNFLSLETWLFLLQVTGVKFPGGHKVSCPRQGARLGAQLGARPVAAGSVQGAECYGGQNVTRPPTQRARFCSRHSLFLTCRHPDVQKPRLKKEVIWFYLSSQDLGLHGKKVNNGFGFSHVMKSRVCLSLASLLPYGSDGF